MAEFDWIKLTLLCLAGAASPGLSWLLILSMSASRGTAVGIFGALGHGLGITMFALTTVFGLSALLLALPEFTVALTFLGTALLIYFGYQLVIAGDMPLPEKLTTQEWLYRWIFDCDRKPEGPSVLLGCVRTLCRSSTYTFHTARHGCAGWWHRCCGLHRCGACGYSTQTTTKSGRIQLVNRLIGALLIASGFWIFIQEISNFL